MRDQDSSMETDYFLKIIFLNRNAFQKQDIYIFIIDIYKYICRNHHFDQILIYEMLDVEQSSDQFLATLIAL